MEMFTSILKNFMTPSVFQDFLFEIDYEVLYNYHANNSCLCEHFK